MKPRGEVIAERAVLVAAALVAVAAVPTISSTPQEKITDAIGDIDDVAISEPDLIVGTTSIYGHEDPAKGTYRVDAIIVSDEPLAGLVFEVANRGQDFEVELGGEIVRSYDRPDGRVISVVQSAAFSGSIGDPVDYSIVAAGLPAIETSGTLEHDGTREGQKLTGPGIPY